MPADVHFYAGRAGTGKTRAIYKSLKASMRDMRACVLIVPEQYTYEAERALSKEFGGLLGVQVLSISRLGERIISYDRPFLNAQGRGMILRREAYRLKNELTYFGSAALRPGFAKSMDTLISRLKKARIAPEELYSRANMLAEQDLLRAKLLDIARLYSAVQSYLDENYIDADDAQNALCAAIPQSFLKGADIFIDELESRNAQVYAILERLMQYAHSVHISVCADLEHEARGEDMLFAAEKRMYAELSERAAQLGCKVFTRIQNDAPLDKDPALIRLERQLYTYPIKPYKGEAGSIRLFGASDRVQEVEALCAALLHAVKNGMRYRDIAVIASDMEAYAPLVQRAFTLHEIPAFFDARRSMRGHPVVELMLAAIKAASRGFYKGDLLRVLKTGLAGVEQADAEAFENICLKRNLMGGKHFLLPFSDTEQAAERARAILMPPLIALQEGLKAKTAGEKARAVYAYLSALRVEQALHEEAERLRAEERFALMEEHSQVYSALMEILEQLYHILGQAQMHKNEFLEVLTEGLKSYQVGTIPATADQALFGDIARTRSRSVRALFLLGANEGLLIKPRMDQEMLDDQELARLSSTGGALWEGVKEFAEHDRFALYRALSRANERLWIGFSYSGNDRELIPAALIERIRAIFPDILIESEYESAQHGAAAFLWLIKNLRTDAPRVRALRDYFLEQPYYGERLRMLEEFSKHTGAPHTLGKPLARELYGRRYIGDASGLQIYRTCPYRYFLERGLRVRARREGREKKADIGSFSHLALERFVRVLLEERIEYAQWTRDDADALLDRILPLCLEEYENGLFLSSPRLITLSQYAQMAVRETAWALLESMRAGSFAPLAAELRFAQGEMLPPIALAYGEARLFGLIDRVDIAKGENGEKIARVIDYKTGDKRFDYTELYDGRALQLPLYLGAVADAGYKPAGMYYQPVTLPVAEEGAEEKAPRALYLKGVLVEDEYIVEATEAGLMGRSKVVSGLSRNQDSRLSKSSPVLQEEEMKTLLEFAKQRAGDIAQTILSGNIEARPVETNRRKACIYCDYRSICRFEEKLGYSARRCIRVDKDAFFALARKKGARHEMD